MTATRLLTRHFLQRFLDNDLISPHADRHEAVSMACAALISSGLFLAVLLSAKYLMAPFPTPAALALVSLDDKFLFVSASMLAMALVTLATWDALPLDGRDTSILGPLPVAQSTVVRAKVAALVLFGAGFALILNVGPSVLFPLFLLARMPVSLADAFYAIGLHLIVTVTAGGFGLLSVLGVRELLRLGLGAGLFRRVSTIVQAALVVFCVTAFLMLPATSTRVARWALAPDSTLRQSLPPVWFLGLYEAAAGHILDRVPRPDVPRRIAARERDATARYRAQHDTFRQLAGRAAISLGVVAFVAMAAYAWNNRKLPTPVMTRATGRRWVGRLLARAIAIVLARRQTVRAGFFFTLQTLPRSAPHRLAIATAFALGLAFVTVSLRGVEVNLAAAPGSAPLVLWVVQTMLLAVVLCGVRHATRVPAFLPASWNLHLAWSGDERAYLGGVKRAAFVALAVPLIVLLTPFHVFVFGPATAAAHAACGLLLARLVLDVLFLGARQPPFARAYVPLGSLKMMAPIGVAGLSVATSAFAAIERWALGREQPSPVFFLVVVAVIAGLSVVDARLRQGPAPAATDDGAVTAPQRLDLTC